MNIRNLKLRNFRNYESLGMEFSGRINVLYGENAQGKTNILEAIFLCSTGRSHRTPRDTDLIKVDKNGYYVNIGYMKEGTERSVEVLFDREGKKRIRVNEIPARRIGELIGNVNTVMFSPEDLMIIKEGPSERRRFIDITLSQIKPTYFHDLQQYAKVLAQRNMLLKEIQSNHKLIDTLDVWDQNLAGVGAKIIKNRAEFVKRLDERVRINHWKLTNRNEELSLKYAPSYNVKNYEDKEEIEKEFNKLLKNSRNRELLKCTTTYGPHRDDYDILMNQMNLKIYGSQGQQRTAVLSVKLSEVDIMKEETGEYPVLLLDDVMSELDMNRQEYLYENLNQVQTFITCTEKNVISKKNIDQCKYYKVFKGTIVPEE